MARLPQRGQAFGALLLATLFGGCLPSAEDRIAVRVDSIVRAAVDRGVVAGASVSVRRRGSELLTEAYGLASIESAREATTSTLFNIGSVTKLFTAAAALTLDQAGALDLDDPLGRWLPALASDPAIARITVRQLLNHTSGLNEYGPSDLARWQTTHEPLQPGFVLSYVRDRPLDFDPGSHWAYSNTGFFLAGLVIEAASGRPWFDYLKEAVLEPLELRDVHLCDDVEASRASGYELVDGQLTAADLYIEAGVRGDGGLCTTPLELTTFLERVEEGRLLSGPILAQMQAPTRLTSGLAVDYGLGTRLGVLEGHRLWGHTGGHAGIVAVAARYPEDDVSISVVVNTIRSTNDALVLEGEIAALVFGIPTEVPSAVESLDLGPFAGRYRGEASEGLRTVSVHGAGLTVSLDGGSPRTLVPISDATFVRQNDPYPLDRYVFHVVNGTVEGYSAYYNGFHGAFYQRLPVGSNR